MDLRRLRLAGALLCAAVLTAAPAAAQAPPPPQSSAPPAPPLQSLPRDATATPPPANPATRPPAVPREHVARPAPDPYRCHPMEDIACTVVRETPQGTVIVTMRPAGAAAKPAVWSVVSGTPPGPVGVTALGGTIYVVPTVSPEPRADLQHPGPANGAPILD